MQIDEIRKKLRTYKVLDNDLRLKAYLAIGNRPEISFSELYRKLRAEKGLLAYHLGVLKAAGLIGVTFERTGKELSKYNLTDEGSSFLREVNSETTFARQKREILAT